MSSTVGITAHFDCVLYRLSSFEHRQVMEAGEREHEVAKRLMDVPEGAVCVAACGTPRVAQVVAQRQYRDNGERILLVDAANVFLQAGSSDEAAAKRARVG
jgi:hypothetical protein